MKTLKEYRAIARTHLKGNWIYAALLMFVYLLILFGLDTLVTLPFMNSEVGSIISSLAVSLLIIPMGYGLYMAFLGLGRGQELRLGELFAHYNMRVWLTIILQSIYTFLWTLLLIIPGIIKSLSYSMTAFVLADNPELSYNQAINKSMEMMKGHKMKLFLLILSFIGWILLSLLTLGIGMFWVAPYIYQSIVAFYEDLKAETPAV